MTMQKSTRRGFLKAVGTTAMTMTAGSVLAADAAEAYPRLILAEEGLLSYLRLSGDLADARNRLTLESRGGEAQFAAGPVGAKALVLEKGRYLTAPNQGLVDVPQLSIELFFQITAVPAEGYNPCLIASRADSPKTRFSIHILRDSLQMALWNGGAVVNITPAGGALKTGRWYHLVILLTPSSLKVFVDGVPADVSQGGVGLNAGQKNLPLQIGASSPSGAEKLDGLVAEVSLYSRLLSEQDILRHVEAAGWAQRRQETLDEKRRRDEEQRRLAEEQRKRRAEGLARRLQDPRLFERGQQRIYKGESLEAISFVQGGIGAGCIQMNGKAERAIWQIFNNFNHATLPHSFFAIRARTGSGQAVVRALQTSAVGPFSAMKELAFRGEYPLAWYDFEDPELPVRVSLEAFSPFIPFDARESSLPCVIFNITVANPATQEAEVTLLASQQNAVGFDGKGAILNRQFAGYGKNRNRILKEAGATILHMTADRDAAAPASGDMALAVLADDASGAAAWDTLRALHEQLAGQGGIAAVAESGPSPDGQTLDGALAVPLRLAPGEKRTLSFVLAWYFPNARHGGDIAGWNHEGNMYANWFDSALAVTRHVRDQFKPLSDQTRLFHDTFYQSNLPHWLLDRVTSQLAVLRSKTCFWAKDGYFGAWEGCAPGSGCCAGSCTHVWHYAQSHARLFPELARKMRESTFGYQHADGGLPHRHPNLHPATDGHCGDILGAWREHLLGGGEAWLEKLWPKVQKAMEFVIRVHDADRDGTLAGAQWNTLDGALGGSTSWIGTLYLAALQASERMATLRGDRDAAERYRRIRESGAKKQDETLWNGEYYIQIRDPEPRQDYAEGCAIDQVLGEWWANQVGLQASYPADRVRTALLSLLKYNFRSDFKGVVQLPRKFVADDDPGLQMIQWPKGPRPSPTILYGDEVMTGFEYAAAAAMVQFGLLREGFMVTLAISDRYDGRLRKDLTAQPTSSWGYSGNPFGDDECGKYYARAMSVWSVLLACQGFQHDGPAASIAFAPVWKPEDHVSFFSTQEGYGLFSQARSGGSQRAKVDLHFGRLRLRKLAFGLPDGAKATRVTAMTLGKPITSRFAQSGASLSVELNQDIVLEAGHTIELEIA